MGMSMIVNVVPRSAQIRQNQSPKTKTKILPLGLSQACMLYAYARFTVQEKVCVRAVQVQVQLQKRDWGGKSLVRGFDSEKKRKREEERRRERPMISYFGSLRRGALTT